MPFGESTTSIATNFVFIVLSFRACSVAVVEVSGILLFWSNPEPGYWPGTGGSLPLAANRRSGLYAILGRVPGCGYPGEPLRTSPGRAGLLRVDEGCDTAGGAGQSPLVDHFGMGAQGRSALGAFGHLQCVIHLDAKVADCALKLPVTKQECTARRLLVRR